MICALLEACGGEYPGLMFPWKGPLPSYKNVGMDSPCSTSLHFT